MSSISGAIQLIDPTVVLVTVRMLPITVATPKSPTVTDMSSLINILLGFKSLHVKKHSLTQLVLSMVNDSLGARPRVGK